MGGQEIPEIVDYYQENKHIIFDRLNYFVNQSFLFFGLQTKNPDK